MVYTTSYIIGVWDGIYHLLYNRCLGWYIPSPNRCLGWYIPPPNTVGVWDGMYVPEEVEQLHMQAQLIPYECVNKDSLCTFYRSHFFWSLLRPREVSRTTFCVVEKRLHLLYHFSGAHSGTRPLESRRKV